MNFEKLVSMAAHVATVIAACVAIAISMLKDNLSYGVEWIAWSVFPIIVFVGVILWGLSWRKKQADNKEKKMDRGVENSTTIQQVSIAQSRIEKTIRDGLDLIKDKILEDLELLNKSTDWAILESILADKDFLYVNLRKDITSFNWDITKEESNNVISIDTDKIKLEGIYDEVEDLHDYITEAIMDVESREMDATQCRDFFMTHAINIDITYDKVKKTA